MYILSSRNIVVIMHVEFLANFNKDLIFLTEIYWNLYIFCRTSNGTTVMKIVVYIFKSGFKESDERIACEALKDSFEELYSIPVFMDNMSAYINCEGKFNT